MPIVMLEGSDGTGKSTLADAVVLAFERQGYETRLEHYSVPKYDSGKKTTIGEQAMNQLTDRLQDVSRDQALILDRFHWGEPVYAPIFRENACVDERFGTLLPREFQRIHDWLVGVGALQVYLKNDPRTIIRRLGTRDDWLLAKSPEDRAQQVKLITQRYWQLILDVESRTRDRAGRMHVHRMGGRGNGFWPLVLSMSRPSDTLTWSHRIVTMSIEAQRGKRFSAPPRFNAKTEYKRGAWK